MRKSWIGRIVAAAALAALAAITAPGARVVAAAPAAPPASTAELEQLFRRNSYAIDLENGALSGPGAAFLEAAAEHSQFFVLGEQHRSREIPDFTGALFTALHRRHGYNHLALEQDPLAVRSASEPPLAGHLLRVAGYSRRYANAFTFDTDQELALIASAGAIRTKGRAVWGLDQMFGATHVLDRLARIAPSAGIRARTKALADQIRPLESERRKESGAFMLPDVEKSRAFLELPAFYPHPRGSEADFLIGQLFKSLEIYRNWWLAVRKGQPTRWAQSFDREENMKELFMIEYRSARRAGEAAPKVLAKLGHYHAIRGENWSELPSLGDFLAQLAKAGGSTSFHLALWNNNDVPGDFQVLADDPDYGALFRAVSPREWRVVDFVPLRGRAYAGDLPGLTAQLRKIIFGFDAALLIGSGRGATYALTGRPPPPR